MSHSIHLPFGMETWPQRVISFFAGDQSAQEKKRAGDSEENSSDQSDVGTKPVSPEQAPEETKNVPQAPTTVEREQGAADGRGMKSGALSIDTMTAEQREALQQMLMADGGGAMDMGMNQMDGGVKMGGADFSLDGTGGVQVKNKPKLIVSNYTLQPEMPSAGSEFQLELTFTNTNSEKSVRNIKITLGGNDQATSAAELKAGLNQSSGGTGSGGPVFTPVGSSNTFYISRINSGDTAEKTIRLKTAPTLAAQNYSINVAFEYEDADGNEFTATEMIGIPVVQQAEILLGDVQMTDGMGGDGLMLGQATNVDMDLYNIGKDPLSTFMVTIEGKGFNVTGSPRYFVGNFASGASDHFTAEITPTENEVSGNILITYEDSTGKKHEEKRSFQKTVEGTDMQNVDPSKLVKDDKTGLLMDPETSMYFDPTTLEPTSPTAQGGGIPWLPVVGFLIVVVVVALVIRHRRKKKAAEEALEIDA